MKPIYLDNSATTQVCPPAAQKALSLMTEIYGNPSSLHGMGFAAEQEISLARRRVAEMLGAKPEEMVFTSGGTEANNLAIFGAVQARRRQGDTIVTTAIEHPSVLGCMAQLEKQGLRVVYLAPDGLGRISAEQVMQAVDSRTILVSLMAVNNETGAVLPVEAAAKAVARAKAPALVHVDAVQAFGKMPLRPQKARIDLLTMSGHKIHAPKGVGALYIRSGVRILPQVFGGGQEKGLRPGTEAVPLIGALGEAIAQLPDLARQWQIQTGLTEECRRLLAGIDGVQFHSPPDASPYVLNFSTGSVRSETMLHFLSERGIFVSSGSACAKARASHVLSAMKLSPERLHTAIRVSFSRYTVQEEIETFVQAVAEGVRTLAKATR